MCHLHLVSAITALVVLTGCIKHDDRVAVHQASGTVTFDGKPAEGVVLQLIPTDDSSPAAQAGLKPGARTAADGSYQVMTYQTADGAPTGTYQIILFWPPDAPTSMEDMQRERNRPARPQNVPGGPPDRFAGKYFSAEKTQWTVTIQDGPNTIEPIHINP